MVHRGVGLLVLAVGSAFAANAVSCRAEEITVACWNVENLFDWRRNELTPDETIPTESVVRLKLRKRAEIIRQLKPDILGMGEVENRYVLQLLCEEYLKEEGYRYYTVIEEKSPRGIDVGMISKRPFFCQSFPVEGFDRGILACRFQSGERPYYVLVNHWKSRLGGGEELRFKCADVVLDLVDRLIPEYEGRKVPVIVMGDLNDEASNPSVKRLLDAGLTDAFAGAPAEKRWTIVYHYRDEGRVAYEGFDHFLLRVPEQATWFRWKEARVEYPPQMLTKRIIDGKEYVWPDRDVRDHVGYSDHMPIVGRFSIGDAP